MSGFQFDPVYWLVVGPAVLFMLYAQWRVKSTYARWDNQPTTHRQSGADVARKLLVDHGMREVSINAVRGELTDHYDPMKNVLSLSQGNYGGTSVAAMAVTAHEVGHAQQDASNSLLMKVRSGIVPLVNIGSQLGPILFVVGLMLASDLLIWLGLILFSGAFLFALVTLPVELDASKRALRMLKKSSLISSAEEQRGANKVLRAAAMTYVAGMLTSLFQLVYYVLLALRGRRTDRSPN